MTPDGEQRPPEPPESKPEYNVYRSRKGLFSRLKGADLSSLRDRARLPSRKPRGEREPRRPGAPRAPFNVRRVLKWVGIAALAWILISFVAFGISAQLQSFKLSGEARDALHGNPFLLFKPQTILVHGTDARPPGSSDDNTSEECFEQQSKGEKPHKPCYEGEFRADTLMLIRAGGGTFRKLSIPRDSFAEIPGNAPTKINAAFAYGGAALQIKTIEQFLGIEIDHVAIVDFTGFEDLIDAVGGVTVDVPVKLCADISGGAGGGQGGVSLRLHKGENTLNGEKALAYSRIRHVSECPGPGKSVYSLGGYDDLDREHAQQEVINGIKDRLTDPLRLPYNFIHGPIIGWDAPKAFVSDMGFFTMPQLILAAGIGGSAPAEVLCEKEREQCGAGPEGSIEVPDSVRQKAVDKLLDG
ncbi:MAG TPA: LCP family protein [Solirubrobacterales bacterium]|nr:LCP family protein [Solirubrobacterales bacterium]